jgi:S-DNA-T family DNA segregation ATPase FtsK/SpoIIIE
MSISVKKMCQVGGFLLLISMLFLALSVGSYSVNDPTWNHYMSRRGATVQNLGGIVGASLADWGLQFLGSTIVLLIGVGCIGALHVMRGRLTSMVNVAWRGTMLLASVSIGTHLLLPGDRLFGTGVFTGGLLGKTFAEVLVHYVNPFGAYLMVGAAGILALFIGVDYRPLWQAVRRGFAMIDPYSRRIAGRAKSWLKALGGVRWKGRTGDEPRPPLPSVEERSIASGLEVDEAPMLFSEQVSVPMELESSTDEEQASSASHTPSRPQRVRKRRPSTLLPSLDLLDHSLSVQREQSPEALQTQARFLEQKLRDFGVEGEVVQVLPGPVITMYEFAPAPGIKVSRIVNLQDDLALVMRALSVRVVAPIPGKAVVGIEIPNRQRETVRLRGLLDSEEFRASTSTLSFALGADILGKSVITDLALIPHLLIAGATGSGKSVGLNSIICSLLFRATPADVKMIMIDPKMLELSIYDGISHLLIPVVTNPKRAAVALRRVVEEMERRYQLLAAKGVRSIAQYNQVVADEQALNSGNVSSAPIQGEDTPAPVEKLPYLVVVIDELSDLMMISSREVEDSLTRIAQMARAAGIHLIVATQRPSVDVLTGVIKANFPARVSFQVSSKTDSRTILDANGAEKLLGRGDMLFLAPGTSKPQRIHGAYVSEAEINRLVEAWKVLEQPHYDDSFLESSGDMIDLEDEEYDEKYDEAVALVARIGQASISMLQRRLRVGYNRAARMIETMEKEGIIGPADGVRPREVLVRKDVDEV